MFIQASTTPQQQKRLGLIIQVKVDNIACN